MKKYLPISQIPREIKDFYNNYQDRYEEIIVTYRDDPLFTVIFKKGSVHIEALTVGDVVRAVDPDTDNRSYTCTPNLVSFDVQNGVLNFVTRCAESRNAWEQRVQFTDNWDLVPEDLRAPGESWQTLVQKFPDVMDLDCRVHCTCLTGDTKIPLLDGRTLTLEEIHKEYGTEKSFWVYATDEKGDFKPGKAHSLGVTSVVDRVIRVVLDNGKEVTCTCDHLFMLRDGTYRRADELKEKDSLMPIYTRSKTVGKRKYQQYKENSSGKWKFVFRTAAEVVFPEEKLEKSAQEDVVVVHHIDFDQSNNSPENLIWFGRDEHLRYHRYLAVQNKTMQTLWDTRREEMLEYVKEAGKISYAKNSVNIIAGREKGIAYAKSSEGREFSYEKMTAYWEQLSEEQKAVHINNLKLSLKNNKAERRRRSVQLKAAHKNGTLLNKEQKAAAIKRVKECTKGNAARNKDPIINAKRSIGKLMRAFYRIEKDCCVSITLSSYKKNKQRLDPKTENMFSTFDRAMYWWHKNKRHIFDKYNKMFSEDLLACAQEVLTHREFLIKDKHCAYCGAQLTRGQKTFCSNPCKMEVIKHTKNHKVSRIENIELKKEIPVYDIRVDTYENFLLDSGVVVHNCPAFLYWGYLYIDTQLDVQLVDENRYPGIRNPDLNGIVCKHLAAVLRNYFR